MIRCPLCGNGVYGYKDEPGFYCSEVFCSFDDDDVDKFLAPFASGAHTFAIEEPMRLSGQS